MSSPRNGTRKLPLWFASKLAGHVSTTGKFYTAVDSDAVKDLTPTLNAAQFA